jgi:NTP pyrophosphatase (non-canonical NTP hydrolase)
MEQKPLGALGQEILWINSKNGWEVLQPEDWGASPYRVPTVLMLLVSEAAEALEAFRAHDRENFAEECADMLIRTLDMACGLGIDMDDAVRKKLEKNKTRGWRHGGKRV